MGRLRSIRTRGFACARFSAPMRARQRTVALALGALALFASACKPGPKAGGSEEPLVTEDIGGVVDAELSTREDVRGPRWVESRQVLPPGFPAQLPLIGDLVVVGSGSTDNGQNYAVLKTTLPPVRIGAEWRSVLADEGWQVQAQSESGFTASRSGVTVQVSVTPAGGGSRLRIVYR